MKAVIGLFVIYLVGHLVLLGVAVSEGFLLHGLIPALDINTGILVGTASTIASVYVFVAFFRLAAGLGVQEQAEEPEEDDEDFPGFFAPLPPLAPRRRRRKKGG
jgi:hypothetical protein